MEVKEECGIAAISSISKHDPEYNSLNHMYSLLLNMQNRGQLSAGFTTFNSQRNALLDTFKNLGTVNEVFRTSSSSKNKILIEKYSGNRAIGHVRYATSGSDLKSRAQPFERVHGNIKKWFSICFNGNLANYPQLAEELIKSKSYHLRYDTDTEVMMHFIGTELSKDISIQEVFTNLSRVFDGAYNISYIDAEGNLAIVRDPIGFKPLNYGIMENRLYAASESSALANIGVKDIKYLNPGEMIIVNNGSGIEIKRFAEQKRIARCFFEWVYFSNPSSSFDGKSVYIARSNLGKKMADLETQQITPNSIVIPVPDTSKAAADTFAYKLSMPCMEGLIRNRHVGRTFIESSNRHDKVKQKFFVLKQVIEGKKVFLIDDSIVRGTTMKRLVEYIKEEGHAEEIHIRITCPPIISPCFYGIDMSTKQELFANKYSDKLVNGVFSQDALDLLAKELGADSLIYLDHEGLTDSIGFPKEELCMACINGDYPTECGKKLGMHADTQSRCGEAKRAYESYQTNQRGEGSMEIKVLIIGNGAREHIEAESFKKSKYNVKLYAYMSANNPGISHLSEEVCIGKYDDFDKLKEFAEKIRPEFAFIGPESPLSLGVVDFLETLGIRSFGPIRQLAQLESSKSFVRELAAKYSITGNPEFKTFRNMEGAQDFLEHLNSKSGFVIKPDGLTGGKGVKVQGEHLHSVEDALGYCREVLSSHSAVVIEEKLVGEEFSLQCISDGKTVVATPPVQDHKRAFDGDQGPNTGGMGSYSAGNHLLPFLDQKDVDDGLKITQQVADAILSEYGKPYKGVMYGGFIKTKYGVKLIEYNARFGDPEAMNTFATLDTDLVDICRAVINGTLDKIKINFKSKATVCKYVVPEGYPDNPISNQKVDVSEVDTSKVKMYFASVDKKEDGLYMSSSRAIGFVGTANTIAEAERIAEEAANKVKGPVFHRKDIGTQDLLQKRVDNIKRIMS